MKVSSIFIGILAVLLIISIIAGWITNGRLDDAGSHNDALRDSILVYEDQIRVLRSDLDSVYARLDSMYVKDSVLACQVDSQAGYIHWLNFKHEQEIKNLLSVPVDSQYILLREWLRAE